jgi:hypothetical protein
MDRSLPLELIGTWNGARRLLRARYRDGHQGMPWNGFILPEIIYTIPIVPAAAGAVDSGSGNLTDEGVRFINRRGGLLD